VILGLVSDGEGEKKHREASGQFHPVEARQDIEILRSKGCKPNEKGHRKKTYKYLRKSMDGSKDIQDKTSASHQI
jgi:hypothetical protein